MSREVKRELLDQGPDGWRIYHLSIPGVQYDTIRVGKYNLAGDYRVETLRKGGWTHLLMGYLRHGDDDMFYVEGVDRAVKVLFA